MAFIPSDLPPSLDSLSVNVWGALERATLEVGRLSGRATEFVHPEVLVGPFLRREAVLSSRIEGTQTSYSDLVFFEAKAEIDSDGDVKEVSNYVAALHYGLERIKEIPVGKQLICELHKVLMTGTSEEDRSGAFRTEQVYIGPRGLPVADSRYVPPPAIHVESAFENLITYINTGDGLPRLMKLAVIHYQFEAIHPFYDGNGRIGRLIAALLLSHYGFIQLPMLYLSAFFERRRTLYNDDMFAVSADGQWSNWIEFFLNGVASQAIDSAQRMHELQTLRNQYWSRINKARNAPALLSLIDALIEMPVMTNSRAEGVLKQSKQSSAEAVKSLVRHGILERLKNTGGRALYFGARPIFNIINRAAEVA